MYTTALVLLLSQLPTYGPGVHIREADRYAQLHLDVAAPAVRKHLHLGAFFPDIRSAGVELPINSHTKAIGQALLDLAEEPWQVAFATGYALHTASDTSAQVVVVPWLTADSGLQAVNLFGSTELAAHADNELLIEGWGDFHSGQLEDFLDLVWFFVVDDEGNLDEVVAFFVAGLAEVVGPDLDVAAVEAEIEAFRIKLLDTVSGFDKATLDALLDVAKDSTLDVFLAIVGSGALGDILGQIPGAEGELKLDPMEVERLMAHPVGSEPDVWFSAYDEHFADLGAAVLDGDGWAPWPWFVGDTIVASILQSFAKGGAPWHHVPDVLIFDAGWLGPDGAPITALDPSALPASITGWSEVFLARGEPRDVTLQVVGNPPGLSAAGAEVLGETTATVTVGPERARIEVVIDPAGLAGGVTAFGLRWKLAGAPLPFLETDFDQYALHALGPLFREPYVSRYGAGGFPPELPVAHAAPLTAWGSVRGHVTASGLRGLQPSVILLDGETPQPQASPVGAFGVEPLDPGPHVLSVAAAGFAASDHTVDVVAGQVTVARLDLSPLPIVSIDPSCCASEETLWTASDGSVSVSWSVAHFPIAPAGFEVSVALSGSDAEPVWQDVGGGTTFEVGVGPDHPDGAILVIRVRADGGPEGEAEIGVDRSPAPAPGVTVEVEECGAPMTVYASGDDPHSAVIARELRLNGGPWEPMSGQLDPGTHIPPYRVEVRLQNFAGLWSEPGEDEVCDAPPVDAEPVAAEPARAAPDAGSLGADTAAPPNTAEDGNGCATTGRRSRPGGALGLLTLLLILLAAGRDRVDT